MRDRGREQIDVRIIDWTMHSKPADGSTQRSRGKLAEQVGDNDTREKRVWERAGLKTHRRRHYMKRDDDKYEEKASDIIALYQRPPAHAAVFCVDEKRAIQALDRLDPVLPLSRGRAERHVFEYI